MGYYLKVKSLGNGESPRYFLLGSVVDYTPEIITEKITVGDKQNTK